MNYRRSLCPVVGVCLFASAACGSNNSSPACGTDNVATTTVDWVYGSNFEAGLYYAAVDPVPVAYYASALDLSTEAVTTQSTQAATAVAQAVGNYYPNGCATAAANQNVVTFNLNNCSGPLGLTNVSGTVVATLNAMGNGQVQTQLTGNNIKSNGATFNLNTSGTAAVSAGQKTLTATSMTTGTGPDGNSIAHAGMYTVLWPTGTNCATINASFTGSSTLDAGGTTTNISNYVACTGKCPQAGTTTTTAEGQSVTLTFSGSNTVQCTASNGQNGSLTIQCP